MSGCRCEREQGDRPCPVHPTCWRCGCREHLGQCTECECNRIAAEPAPRKDGGK